MQENHIDPLISRLARAVEESDAPELAELLRLGVDPNSHIPPEALSGGSILLGHMSGHHGCRALSRYPALLTAVLRGDVECIRLLLEAGANAQEAIDAGGHSRWSALELACTEGNAEVVRLLVQHGAGPVSERRVSLLSTVSAEVIVALLDLPQPDYVLRGLTGAVVRFDHDVIEKLLPRMLEMGARFDEPEREESPLYNAVSTKRPETVRLLLEAGATVTRERQSHAMSRACAIGFAEGIDLLTHAGAVAHERDIGHAVASRSDEAIVAILENCRRNGCRHRNMILPRRASMSPVVEAIVKGGYVKAARYLFSVLGEDPFQKTSTGASILRISNPEIKEIITSARTQGVVADAIGGSVDLPVVSERRPKSTGEPL